METENGTNVFVADNFFIVSIAKESEGYAVCTKGRFNNVRNISFVGFGIEIVLGFAGMVAVLSEVIVSSAGASGSGL